MVEAQRPPPPILYITGSSQDASRNEFALV
jgi:hypothetical protein